MSETPEQKAQRILDMQCPSTRRALARNGDEDAAWRNRPNPVNWLAVADAKNMDEAVGGRAITFRETSIEEGLRQRRGQILTDIRDDRNRDTLTPDKRQAAVAAFTFVKIKFHDFMKACGLATEKEVEFAKRHEE